MVRRFAAPILTLALVAALIGAGSADFDDPTQVGPAHEMTFPVIGKVSFTDTYGAPRGGGTREHEGQDIMGPKMLQLVAATTGTITRLTIPQPTYGYSIVIKGDNGWSYHYLHLNNDTPGTDDGLAALEHVFAPGLELGSRVNAGQLVGYLGDSGNAESTAPHLHFELHDPTGLPVNPYAALKAATRMSAPGVPAPDVPDLPRIYGEDRVATAIAASKSAWSSSGHVVLASGHSYAEALPASVLAARLGGPLLLADEGDLSTRVMNEIGRLQATTVTVIGSVPPTVDALLATKVRAVTRIAGADSFETAALLAKRIGATNGNAVVVNADRFADGISAAALSAGRSWPILLVTDAEVPAVTRSALTTLKVTKTHVVGGTAVVSDALTATLPGVVRYAGADRYGTSVAVLEKVVALGGRSLLRTYLATGTAYPDALTAGALAARTRGVVLLVDGTGSASDAAAQDFLAARATEVALKAVLGGFAAVGIESSQRIGALFGIE